MKIDMYKCDWCDVPFQEDEIVFLQLLDRDPQSTDGWEFELCKGCFVDVVIDSSGFGARPIKPELPKVKVVQPKPSTSLSELATNVIERPLDGNLWHGGYYDKNRNRYVTRAGWPGELKAMKYDGREGQRVVADHRGPQRKMHCWDCGLGFRSKQSLTNHANRAADCTWLGQER